MTPLNIEEAFKVVFLFYKCMQVTGLHACTYMYSTRWRRLGVTRLSSAVDSLMIGTVVSIQPRRVTHRQTDRQTDRQEANDGGIALGTADAQ